MAFVRNAWYVVCTQDAIKSGEPFARQILGEKLAFYRKQDGTPVAVQDRCPHRFIPLSMGKVVGDLIECAYHGLQFDCSGSCVKNPHGDGRIPAAARVASYPVHEKHGLVWVWMGDKAADPASIPDYSVLDEGTGFSISGGYLHMECDYELMGENLLDLSHITYLHDGYLGSPEQVGADQVMLEKEDGVQCNRWMPNVSVPGIFDLLYRRDGQPVDMWTNMRWMAPSCFLLDTGVHAVGGEREDHGWYYGVHILTPETENTTHYHFIAAMPPGTKLSEQDDEKFRTLRRYAFEMQDKPMIHAQQQAIGKNNFWDLKPVLLSVDAGPVRMRRTLEKMVKQEQAEREAASQASTAPRRETASAL